MFLSPASGRGGRGPRQLLHELGAHARRRQVVDEAVHCQDSVAVQRLGDRLARALVSVLVARRLLLLLLLLLRRRLLLLLRRGRWRARRLRRRRSVDSKAHHLPSTSSWRTTRNEDEREQCLQGNEDEGEQCLQSASRSVVLLVVVQQLVLQLIVQLPLLMPSLLMLWPLLVLLVQSSFLLFLLLLLLLSLLLFLLFLFLFLLFLLPVPIQLCF